VSALTHEVDLGQFSPLSVEQLYYLVRFISDRPDHERGHRHLASRGDTPPLDELARYINSRCPDTEAVEPGDLVGPWKATAVLESSPVAKYSFWCQLFPDPWFTFMNYGYQDGRSASSSGRLTGDEELWSHAVALYDQAVPVDLRGRDAVEIGCGRGGGAAFLARTRHPLRYLGLDRARSNILFCRERHSRDNLAFAPGLATDIPLHDESCDVIVNVESAPYYHPIEAFARSAARVLRRGGHVCLATYGPEEDVWHLRDAFLDAGLALAECVEITANVREALASQDRGRAVLARVETSRSRAIYEREFASIYDPDHLNDAVYVRFVFSRPDGRLPLGKEIS